MEDIRSDRGGRYYIQIREDKFKTFGKILDQHLKDDEDTWNIELDDLGKFEVSYPYQSISTGKIPSSLGTSMKASLQKTPSTASPFKTRLDRKCPPRGLLNTYMTAPHLLNRRKRDPSGNPLPEWLPICNLRVFISRNLHEKIFAGKATSYANLDYMILPIRIFNSPTRPIGTLPEPRGTQNRRPLHSLESPDLQSYTFHFIWL